MNDYQLEQMDAWTQLQSALARFSKSEIHRTSIELKAYIAFRNRVDQFTHRHFGPFCTNACFQNAKSACCSKDGIITFWADLVVNAFCSDQDQLARLRQAIETPVFDNKCIYLSPNGCLWSVRPMVCGFFLCDPVQNQVLNNNRDLSDQWSQLKATALAYRWPDKPVLFDRLESIFIEKGCDSSLMVMHNSPGLLRIKEQAGLIDSAKRIRPL